MLMCFPSMFLATVRQVSREQAWGVGLGAGAGTTAPGLMSNRLVLILPLLLYDPG